MIQAILLIALGFLIATLIGVLIAPSLWSRASRLSKKTLESTLPLTLAEIEAAQDQLRATYAVRVRRLETSLGRAKQKAANQLVENSRLHMQIAELKDQIADLDLELAERRNAANVLEQTITKRFPELDREIAAVKARLQERTFELEDATGKLARREEELAAAQEAAASYQEELQRLHQVLERSAADRSGRRVRRASQWDLEDYRAEYDRLNLELSKLRQQLALYQERDAQQLGIIKGELQKLAESILASAQQKDAPFHAGRVEPPLKRGAGQDPRKEKPAPWLQNAQPPKPLLARLRLDAEKPAAEPATAPAPRLPSPEPAAASGPAIISPSPDPSSPPEMKMPAVVKNGQAEGSGRPSILQEVIPPKNANGAELDAETPSAPAGEASVAKTAVAPAGDGPAASQVTPNEEADSIASGTSKTNGDPGPAAGPRTNGVNHTPVQSDDQQGPSLTDVISLEALKPDSADDKIGPNLPTLLERLRGVSKEPSEEEKAPPAAQGLG